MPSIRVRNSYYSLNDHPTPPFSPRSLTTLFSPTTPADTLAPPPRPRPSLPVLRGRRDTLTSAVAHPQSRPNTIACRVQSHVLRNSTRNLRVPTYHRRDRDIATESPQPPRLGGSQADATSSEYFRHSSSTADIDWDGHHHDDVVEHLDAIDPQVGAVSTLTNTVNSIVIPPSPFYSRKPVINLPLTQQQGGVFGSAFEDALDRHVDDLIKRPSTIRRTLLGVWAFLKTPIGIITGIYGFLVVFWGAAIVIFLARIINFHNDNTQGFWVEVASQVENGLFTATGIGLIPSRVVDTYRIYKIWRYKQKTIRLRKKAGLPQLFDVDDLPDPAYDIDYVRVLTDEEQEDLHRQQMKFQYHQTWYRAHGGETHRAFPINTALLICFLNDGNSIFQILLCGTMWGLNRFQRPAWSTGTLIPASFLCGIGAAVCIWRGGEKTKRVAEVRERLRAALAQTENPSTLDRIRSPSVESQVRLVQSLHRKNTRDRPAVEEPLVEKLIVPDNDEPIPGSS